MANGYRCIALHLPLPLGPLMHWLLALGCWPCGPCEPASRIPPRPLLLCGSSHSSVYIRGPSQRARELIEEPPGRIAKGHW